jgi:5'(3')-deoxyribonucleotidase
MFITHRKDLLIGDYLIDDRLANGAESFKGELIHFGKDYKTFEPNPFPTWESVLKYLLA